MKFSAKTILIKSIVPLVLVFALFPLGVQAFHEDDAAYTGCPGSTFQGPPSPNTNCPPAHEPGEYPPGWSSIGRLDSANDLGLPLVDVGQNSTLLQDVLATVFLITGGLATVFIVVGGFRYVISAGNPSAIEKAKNTVLYAVIGLVLSVLAGVIVNFVITSL